MAVCVPLAIVNFEHWDEYRSFIASLRPHFVGKRVWINGEWGLRYYVEKEGGLPMRESEAYDALDALLVGHRNSSKMRGLGLRPDRPPRPPRPVLMR